MGVQVFSYPYMFTKSGADKKPLVDTKYEASLPKDLDALKKVLKYLAEQKIDDEAAARIRCELLFYLASQCEFGFTDIKDQLCKLVKEWPIACIGLESTK
jgi:hypothetical protein